MSTEADAEDNILPGVCEKEKAAQEERILLSRLGRKGVGMATKSQRFLSIH